MQENHSMAIMLKYSFFIGKICFYAHASKKYNTVLWHNKLKKNMQISTMKDAEKLIRSAMK